MTHLLCPVCAAETSLTDDLDHDRLAVARACGARDDDEHRRFLARHCPTLPPPSIVTADDERIIALGVACAREASVVYGRREWRRRLDDTEVRVTHQPTGDAIEWRVVWHVPDGIAAHGFGHTFEEANDMACAAKARVMGAGMAMGVAA